jgi:hypothetical protein
MKLVLKKVPGIAPLVVTTSDLTGVIDISNAPVASGSQSSTCLPQAPPVVLKVKKKRHGSGLLLARATK